MPGFVVKDFGGMMPRRDSRLLPESMAEASYNVDLSAGTLQGLPAPLQGIDLSAYPVTYGTLSPGQVSVTPQRAYRLPDPAGVSPDSWLALPDKFCSVVRSPLANDTLHRIYWTTPGHPPQWTNYAGLQSVPQATPYTLGVQTVDAAHIPNINSVTGGTTTIPQVVRAYLVTYFDHFGGESAPSLPSNIVSGPPDATWTVGFSNVAPAQVAGLNYPPVAGIYLYRTVTAQGGGTQFYRVAQIPFGGVSAFVDQIPDTTIVQNLPLPSSTWSNPPATLDGLTSMPGGFLVGFTGNTLHFSEPNQPNAWPTAYDLSVQYDIVALAVWQQSLIILTKGYPLTGTGNSPSNFTLSEIQVPEPCIARGSVITDLLGVYYASQNGLVMLNYYGMQNQTLQTLTKNIWLKPPFSAGSIVACRHRAQYLAISGNSSTGFLIDYTEQRCGIELLTSMNNVYSVWNDAYTGKTYMMSQSSVYEWDSQFSVPQVYRWRSKQFYLPAPANFGACQVSLGSDVAAPVDPMSLTLSDSDPTLVLPPGVNAIFRIIVHGYVLLEHQMTQQREIFRLPSGFKAFDWQFEIVSRCQVYSVELATTMMELKGV